MRTLQAIVFLLLFSISHGSCWADSLGLFSESPLSCCQPVHHCSGDHDHEAPPSEPDESEDTHDCLGCQLIQSGFTHLAQTDHLPAPSFAEKDLLFQQCITAHYHALDHPPRPTAPPPPGRKLRGKSLISLLTDSVILARGPDHSW